MKNTYKNTFKNRLSLLGTLSIAALVLGACDLREKGGKAADQAAGEIAKTVNSCEGYNTENDADAKNEVRLPGNEYKFDLYWLGRDEKMTVWENDALNDFYSIQFSPLVVKSLDNQTQAVRDEDICLESEAKAGECIERFQDIITMVDEAKQSYANAGVSLSEGKEMTFRCSRAFSEKRVVELKAFQDQQ